MGFKNADTEGIKNVGVMMVEEPLGFVLQEFIRAACPHQISPEHISASWRSPARRPPSLGTEITFLHFTTLLDDCCIHLFSFPEALSRSFSVDDLRFPLDLEGMGFIVLLDIDALSSLRKGRLPTTNSDPISSPLAWALAHNLPSVVLAKGYASAAELRDTLEVSPATPVWCSSEFREDMMPFVLEDLAEQFANQE